MEEILMALFGGGYGDWNDLIETKYGWETIIDRVKDKFGSIDRIDINDLYYEIMEMAKEDFCYEVGQFINENKEVEDLKVVVETLENFDFDDESIWSFNANCLASSLYLNVNNEEVVSILENYLEKELDNINDKIGFTYINIQ